MTRCDAARRRSMSTASADNLSPEPTNYIAGPGWCQMQHARAAASSRAPEGGRGEHGDLDVGSLVARLEERVDRGAARGVADCQPHHYRVRAGQAGDAYGADLERGP